MNPLVIDIKVEDQSGEAKRLNALVKKIEKRIDGVECPDHHATPHIRISGTLEHPKLSIKGACCQKLVDLSRQAIKH
jgi:hypothetical protein